MKRLFVFIFCISLFSGCHWFDDPNDLEDCPLGSSFPCPCTTNCEGDDVCVLTEGSRGSYGQCTLPCYGNHQLCTQAADGFGSGICMDDGYCAIACYDHGDCPAGMGCDNNICTPGFQFDPSVETGDSATTDTATHDTTKVDTTTVDTGTGSDTGGTDTGDTDSVDTISDAQRQAECVATCSKAFECSPDDQPYSLQDFINACVDDNWHADACGACRLNCDTTGTCNDVALCFAACDELDACASK